MERKQFQRFSAAIARGDACPLEMASEGRYSLRYIPFEYVNPKARLVIVGITPGPNQLAEAYAATRRLLAQGISEQQILTEVIRIGAFSGPAMRPNLVRMLEHFRIHELLGVSSAAAFWGSQAEVLHSTSVVPHAAFKNGKKFAGRFDEVLRVRLLRECFTDCFVPSLRELRSDALYLGLGSTAEAALTWCVDSGVIADEQLLGAFPHPSTESGSQVDIFIGTRSADDLKPKDPVRSRLTWLNSARAQLVERISRRLAA